ncbi:MAG TPA: hypothetical protein VGO58_17230 [Chitinophagaceae bacterium]|jgi:tetratricopeptide (TPR) repeat protein|nr:hypothetical protein [Chitinophagaceae bacterium]
MRGTLIFFAFFFCTCNQRSHDDDSNREKTDQLNKKSYYFLENKQFDSAKFYTENVLIADPQNYVAYNNRAIVRVELGFPPDSVIIDFKRSLKIRPDYEIALYSLAIYYFEIKDYEHTIKAANDFFMLANMQGNDSTKSKHILSIKKTSEEYTKRVNGIPLARAIAYYDSINSVYVETSLPQQAYIDKVVKLLMDIKGYKKIQLTNSELKQSLNNAIKMGQLCFSKIEKITEVDSVINLKQAVLDYTSALNNFYNDPCREYLSNLEKIRQVGLFIIADKVNSKLFEIKKAGTKFLGTRKEFTTKYGFSARGT